MSSFLVIMLVGLAGLALMAFGGHRHHGAGRGHVGHGHGHAMRGLRGSLKLRALQWLPEPRGIFSFLALFGAFGNLLEHRTGFSIGKTSLLAAVAAVVLELLIVGPLWRFALRFQGRPASSLHALVLERGQATTPFRNGKGMVEVVHDGRTIQLVAQLRPDQKALAVEVGDSVQIDDVDIDRERVVVSVV